MKKILIIEDNELNMKLFSDILEYNDYKVEKAQDGEMGYKKSRLVFQPHTYTRTKALFDQFADVLEGDEIFVLPTFAAREKPIAGFESCDLVDEIKKRGKNARYIGDVQRLVDILNCKQVDDEVILLVGAGDVDKIQTMLK